MAVHLQLRPPDKRDEIGAGADLLAGAPLPVLCITEEWIRERLNLKINSLESVQSLALPGGYSEKITHLGRSLIGFTNLKHVDLSRNALESLQGVEHLKQLESLNIYYNRISSLKELFLLSHNAKLKELDIRLNPVTQSEPDYRLFLIHMLVHLRKLDGRSVVDSERRAALMHFNSDQAYQIKERLSNGYQTTVLHQGSHNSNCVTARAKLVQSLTPYSALQDNTDELLELVERSDHLLQPKEFPEWAEKESARMETVVKDRLNETEAYGDFKVKVNFTPAPSQPQAVSSSEDDPAKCVNTLNLEQKFTADITDSLLTQLIDLLQQYIPTDILFLARDTRLKGAVHELWEQTGRKGTATEVRKLEDELITLRQQLHREQSALKEKDTQFDSLRKKLNQQESQLLAKLQQIRQDVNLREEMMEVLQQANNDISTLRKHVRSLQEENAQVKAALDKAPKAEQLSKLNDKIGQLEAELSSVQQQQQRETHSHTKLHEMTAMLQESHRSLVATNHHLLKELAVEKLKHSEEVSQMHQNYQHLKKTLNLVNS